MQEHAYEGAEGGGQTASGFARLKGILSTAIGAIVAMSLLMTLGIWFYRLGVRDAQNVPIIRAAAEPAKERPQDPGGTVAPHQNIESYEVASDQPASAAAIVIAPEPPSPRPEDVPLGEIAAAPAPIPELTLEQAVDAAVAEVTGEATGQTTGQAAEQATGTLPPINNTVALGEEPQGTQVAALDQPSQDTPAEPEPEPQPVVAGTAFAPALSPVAPRRPANLVQRTAAAADQAERKRDDLVRSAAASRVQIQLAADPDEGAMRALWNRVRKANGDILGDRTLAIQTTQSGGRTFYRLRIGPFRDDAEARNICQALKARGQDCIVAKNG